MHMARQPLMTWSQTIDCGCHIIAKLTEAEWRVFASESEAIVGSDDTSSPVRHRVIISINAGFLFIEPPEQNSAKFD